VKSLVIGSGPVGALLHHVLCLGEGSSTWSTGVGHVADRRQSAGSQQPHSDSRELRLTRSATPFDGVEMGDYDAVIIAQPPWIAVGTASVIASRIDPSRCRIFGSSNGLWWHRASAESAFSGALSVTSRVWFAGEHRIRVTPRGSGFILGPPSSFVNHFVSSACQAGFQCAVGAGAESVVAAKCLVNSPLSLQYGLHQGSISDILEDDHIVQREAAHLLELVELTRKLGSHTVRTPGFDLRGLHACALDLVAAGSGACRRAVTAFSGELRKWRQNRVPALGHRIRIRDRSVLPEVRWMWGEIVRSARRLRVDMPVTTSLYGQVLSVLRARCP
jgi:hypothetical protein